jgi:uncharacterized membrane protein
VSDALEYFTPVLSSVLESVCGMVSGASGSLMLLLLDALEPLLKLDLNITARAEGVLVPLLIDVWMKDTEGSKSFFFPCFFF